jgi:hypothetical protein
MRGFTRHAFVITLCPKLKPTSYFWLWMILLS